MKSLDDAIRSYLADVRKNLVCNGKIKKQLLTDIRSSVFDYVQSNHVTDIDSIRNHFGTPEELARSFMPENDVQSIQKKIRFRRITLVLVGLLLVALFVLMCFMVKDQIDGNIAFYSETIIEGTVCKEASLNFPFRLTGLHSSVII